MTLKQRLRHFFSSKIILRRKKNGLLKVLDSSANQSVGNITQTSSQYSYRKLFASTAYDAGNQIDLTRIQLFQDFEQMDSDPIISSALDIVSDEVCTRDEHGDILKIESGNSTIKEILKNLFYDVLNIEFNLKHWVRAMLKYGDFFLKLDIKDKYGIINVIPMSPYVVKRVETINEKDMTTDVKFYIDETMMGSNLMNIHRAFIQAHSKNDYFEYHEVAHFRLLKDSNFLPYGKSYLMNSRRVWKQLYLLEDAMLIHRIMRAPEKRIFKIDVGNIAPNEVDAYMEKMISAVKKTPHINNETGDYNLHFNLINMLEDYFLPVRGGESGTSIETLPGMEYNPVDDIEYIRKKLLAGLQIPAAFLTYDQGIAGKAVLASEDLRFGKMIENIQNMVVSELKRIGMTHLIGQGFEDDELLDFDLSLNTPSTIYKQEKIALLQSQIEIANSMRESKLFSLEYIYKEIFSFSDEQISKMQIDVVNDLKQRFRLDQIEKQGNDPKVSGKIYGVKDYEGLNVDKKEYDPEKNVFKIPDDKKKKEGDSDNPVGRPPEHHYYATDKHPLGRDPIGGKQYKKDEIAKRPTIEFRNGIPVRKIKESMKKRRKILNEEKDLDEKIIKDAED